MVFDEDVVPRYARVVVVTSRGQQLASSPQVAGNVVTVPLRARPIGSYTVRWRMVAADDGHVTEGAYSFGVRVKPLAPAAVGDVGIPVAPEVLAWLQFLGVVLAGGMLSVRALVAAPGRSLGSDGAPGATLALWTAVAGAVVAVHAGVLAFLAGAYPIIGGRLTDFINAEIEPIRVGTHLGQAWMVTTFAWFGVLLLLVAAWVTPRRREPLLAGAGVASLATAFGITWASHPASRGFLGLVADYVHLLAAALWVGGLVALLIITATASSSPPAVRGAVARRSILRFSRIALPTVVLIAVAGIVLTVRDLPTVSSLFSSAYGVTLLVKSAIVLGALGLAGYHRRFVVPRLEAGAPVHTIRRTLALELCFLLTALVLAAILNQTAPPA
jgi:copper transport protein